MVIFVASLPFKKSSTYVDSAKIGILLSYVIYAIIGYLILWFNNTKEEIIG